MFEKVGGKILWRSKDAKLDDGTEYTHPGTKPDERSLNCVAFRKPNGCSGEHMRSDSNRPRLPNGNVKVSPFAWCRWWKAKK